MKSGNARGRAAATPGSVPVGGGRPHTLLDIAADVLGANPSASLAEVAAAAGIGRTTLHKQYATRQELLKAIAVHVLDRAEEATRIAAAVARDGASAHTVPGHAVPVSAVSAHAAWRDGPNGREDDRSADRFRQAMVDAGCAGEDGAEDTPAARVACALEMLVREFIPLGGGLAFLVRHPMFDDDETVQRRFAVLEPAIVDLVRAGQQHRVLRTDLPDWWFVRTLYAQVRVAAEGVAYGRLAPLAAPDLVLNTLVEGLGAR